MSTGNDIQRIRLYGEMEEGKEGDVSSITLDTSTDTIFAGMCYFMGGREGVFIIDDNISKVNNCLLCDDLDFTNGTSIYELYGNGSAVTWRTYENIDIDENGLAINPFTNRLFEHELTVGGYFLALSLILMPFFGLSVMPG